METVATSNSETPLEHVIVCGAGLAGCMTVAALAHHLPVTTQITWLDDGAPLAADIAYGGVTGSSAYEFNLWLGLTEPHLLSTSETAFSLGTAYHAWGKAGRSWIQCFHAPFSGFERVPFHHYLSRQGIDDIEPYLISAVAARRGVFVHPPETSSHPMSAAEYGYQFDVTGYRQLFEGLAGAARVDRVHSAISRIAMADGGIEAIILADGQSRTAQLYIDCTGPGATVLSNLAPGAPAGRRLGVVAGRRPAGSAAPVVRTVTAADYGWQSDISLHGSVSRLTVFDPEEEARALAAHDADVTTRCEIVLGGREQAWSGNCVAVGHAAAVIEPLTPAPMMLLQRDIERLLALFPCSGNMTVERREYNRRFCDDYSTAAMFNRAFFATGSFPSTAYWRAAQAEPIEDRLARKLELFASRGLHVGYDLEPFHQEDWIVLHYGLGLVPRRYDRLADQPSDLKVQNYLTGRRDGIRSAVDAMPPYEVYRRGLMQYLSRNKG